MSSYSPTIDAPLTVLVVDRKSEFTAMVATHLESLDDKFTVLTEQRAQTALDTLHTNDIDCIVSSHQIRGQNGLEFLETVYSKFPALPYIFLTETGSDEIGLEALDRGADVYLQKEPAAEQLPDVTQQIVLLVEKYRAEQNVKSLENSLSMIERIHECAAETTRSHGESVSTTVVEEVADREDVDPSELQPTLYEVLDPEALDALITSGQRGTNHSVHRVEFTYQGYRITVSGDGLVGIKEEREP